jgi:hypothetical protein
MYQLSACLCAYSRLSLKSGQVKSSAAGQRPGRLDFTQLTSAIVFMSITSTASTDTTQAAR